MLLRKDRLPSLISYMVFVIFCSNSPAAALRPEICYDGRGTFTANSTYARNLKLLLSSLAANVMSTSGSYYTATAGEGDDKVYASALCRADDSAEACFSCVNQTASDLLKLCRNWKEAIAWGGKSPCVVHYANRLFFGTMESGPLRGGSRPKDISGNLDQFDPVWEDLMEEVAKRASSGNSSLKFGTGEANVTSFVKIHALMQCNPDVSQIDCSRCLRGLVGYYQTCCHGKRGGSFQKPSCFFRWDFFRFYSSSLAGSPTLSTDSTTRNRGGSASRTFVIVVVMVALLILVSVGSMSFALVRKRRQKAKEMKGPSLSLSGLASKICEAAVDVKVALKSLQMDFLSVRAATDDFSVKNKLGQGGFGVVYKGVLPSGEVIAVKRLRKNSEQGDAEFKNEVLLMAGLQHRNLVRLLGFCLEGDERLLIYEFLPNSSLDRFLFSSVKRAMMDWDTRNRIILGTAKGILYLHEDSQIRIIHRDLKAANILLDAEMNPKISDFGMAKLFNIDQTHEGTQRIVGTLGYMAPECIRNGHYSVKSDIYSFGVLVLEIICGQSVNNFRSKEGNEFLLTYTWRSCKRGATIHIIDPFLREDPRVSEMVRFIQIGLLCVQEDVAKRPSMASVVIMLTQSSFSLPVPSEPAFFIPSYSSALEQPQMQIDCTENIMLLNHQRSQSSTKTFK